MAEINSAWHAVGRADGSVGRVDVEAHYNPDDPLVVTIVFNDVPWIVSRDLLWEAGAIPNVTHGMGDVRAGVRGESFLLMLESPEGKAVIEIPRQMVRKFLDRTHRLVPVGSEVVDVDWALERILGG